MPQIGEKLRHRQDEDQLHPLRRLEVIAAGHFDPALGPQVFLPKDQHSHEGSDRRNIKPMDPIEQRLVVHCADGKHHSHAR